MRTEQINIYTFGELSERAKERALDAIRDMNVGEGSDWYGGVFGRYTTALQILGFDLNIGGIRFFGFWAQGDGASFTGRYTHQPECLDKLKKEFPRWDSMHDSCKWLGTTYKDFEKLTAKGCELSGEIARHSSHYVHQNTVEFHLLEANELNDRYSIPADALDGVESDLNRYFRAIMQELYDDLNDRFDTLTSDACVKEAIQDKGLEFTIDGSVYG